MTANDSNRPDYDPRDHWKSKSVFLPVSLAARLRETAARERKPEKTVIIEALERRLPVPGSSKPSDESGNR